MAATAANRCASRPPIITASRIFQAKGSITIDDKTVDVTGQAWLDREWSSQPLASDQNGWDWLSLHFKAGEKLMLYRMRQTDGQHYGSGKWVARDGSTEQLASADISFTPLAFTEIAGRKIPTSWRIAIPKLAVDDRLHAAQCEELDGNEFSLLGRPDQFCRQPQRIRLSGDDGVLKVAVQVSFRHPRRSHSEPRRMHGPWLSPFEGRATHGHLRDDGSHDRANSMGTPAMYHFTALVTCLAILFYFFTSIQVSKARGTFGVKVPAISGNPDFERVFRVQMNTLEWMPIFLPSLWLFAIYISDPVAAALGLVWIIGRIL